MWGYPLLKGVRGGCLAVGVLLSRQLIRMDHGLVSRSQRCSSPGLITLAHIGARIETPHPNGSWPFRVNPQRLSHAFSTLRSLRDAVHSEPLKNFDPFFFRSK